ncbi:MAG: hypothetical protein M3N21_03800, partial [Actinomycetota bacterium]|nr:hypothetical protein [Actinomycetota bacterium]
AAGGSYQLTLSPAIKDLVGHSAVPSGSVATVGLTLDDPSPGIVYAGNWAARFSSNALGGGYHRGLPTPGAQTSATASFFGSGVIVGACAGPGNGIVDLYIDGTRRARVDTYRSYSGCGVVIGRFYGLGRGLHRVQFRGVGLHQAASRGSAVGLDAFRALP